MVVLQVFFPYAGVAATDRELSRNLTLRLGCSRILES